MKKILIMTLIGVFTFTGLAFAAFENKTQEEIRTQLIAFYNEIQGNRLSGYAMDGLLIRINKIFSDNIVTPKPPEKEIKDGTLDK